MSTSQQKMNVDALTDHEVLSRAAERRLFAKVQEADGVAEASEAQAEARASARARRARERIVRQNLRLVAKQARSYYLFDGATHDYDDLFQAGVEGLIRAVELFDPSLGYRFSTYAVRWIRQSIGRYLYNHATTIRLPVGVHADHDKARKKRAALAAHGREPSGGEVARAAGISERRLGDVERYHDLLSATRSLQEPVAKAPKNGEAAAYAEAHLPDAAAEDPEEQALRSVDEAATSAAVAETLAALPPDLEAVVRLRFGLGTDDEGPLNLNATGQRLGMCHEAVRQREQRALAFLSAVLGARLTAPGGVFPWLGHGERHGERHGGREERAA